MTEIKITGDGLSESDGSAVGAESSSGARAPDEGSSAGAPEGGAPPPSQESRTADGAPADSGSEAYAHDGEPDEQAAEVESDLSELVETARQRDEYLALAQRTQADFENYRKRVAREAAAARERGVGAVVKELLPALDNLDRALEAAAADDPLLHGVRLVRSELAAALARVGVESFSPEGEQFDPEVHEAVATAAQAPGGRPSGTVVEVYAVGYRLGANVVRPARVVVVA